MVVVVSTDLPIATSAADTTYLGAVVVTVGRVRASEPTEVQTFAHAGLPILTEAGAELRDSGERDVRAPTDAGTLGDCRFVAIAAGQWHSCAVRDDGTMWCWGLESFAAPFDERRDSVNGVWARRISFALPFAMALSCGPSNGRLIVVVSTDLGIATSAADTTSLGAVVVTVGRVSGPTEVQTFAVRETQEEGTFTMPLSFAVAPTSSDATVEITVDGTDRSGTRLVRSLARVRIVPGPTRVLSMFLADACRGFACPLEETCDRGDCVPIPSFDLGSADPGLPLLTKPGAELDGGATQGADAACVEGSIGCALGTLSVCVEGTVQETRCWYGCRSQPGGCVDHFVAAGGGHTCFARADGLWCWGENSSGQLGDGTGIAQPTPARILASGPAVSTGGAFTCATSAAGAFCWGDNSSGQLGDGGTSVRGTADESVLVVEGASFVSAGGLLACAIETRDFPAGALHCWGNNTWGQLGNGMTSSNRMPVIVTGFEGDTTAARATMVSAGSAHACAVGAQDGRIYCWGRNQYGQLGDGGPSDRGTPTPLDLYGALSISAGDASTCAVISAGGVWTGPADPRGSEVYCWGLNMEGALGNGTFLDSSSPSRVMGVTDALEVDVGSGHACARGLRGELWCWGRNGYGEVGDGTQMDRPSPFRVDIEPIADVSVGATHTCALARSGALYCWGNNSSGQLGDGTSSPRLLPTPVASLP